jgi:DNA helicase-2/ATP-dependent DNA helicase PcrA
VALPDAEALRQELNPPQWQAVSHAAGPLLVLAGAGSGKTRVLTYRIAYLVDSVGVPPWAILALTFTNKAAREMERRVRDLLGSDALGTWIGTFHGVCLRILRRHGELLPVGREFSVFDTDDQKKVAAAVVQDMGLDPKRFKAPALLYRVSRAKDEGQGPDDLDLPLHHPLSEVLPEFFVRYDRRLRAARALDFSDLLLEALNLFATHPEVAADYRTRFRHVLIDEYQDTNRVQYRLARELAAGHGNLCVVGDDDQSIYSWRGADIRNILAFEKDFPGTTTVKLEQNYRSTAAILQAASAVVACNRSRHPKVLWTDRGDGAPVVVREAPTEEEEAAWAVAELSRLHRSGHSYADCAVLYRMHAQSRAFEEALLRHRIPYVVYGGLRFYDRKEVRDTLAYLRLVLNPDDPVAFLRVVNTPPRGIGKTTVDRLLTLSVKRDQGLWQTLVAAVEEGLVATRAARAVASFVALLDGWRDAVGSVPLRDLLGRIVQESGYAEALRAEGGEQAETRLENLEELLNAAEAFEQTEQGGIREFLDRAALVSDQDRDEDRADAVTLMTLHAAKGLEYPAVFLTGLEEGVFPHHMSADTPAGLEEERRLCYVGMTRARDRLYLSRARIRRVYGAEGYFRPPSRFLQELPPEVYPGVTAQAPGAAPSPMVPAHPETPRAPTEAGRFFAPEPGEAAYRAGMVVRHPTYGSGSVVRVDGHGQRAKVTVRFADSGTRKFIAAMAGLEIALDD